MAGNWAGGVSLTIAVLALGVSSLSALASWEGLRQHRESLLLDQRLGACAGTSRAAEEVVDAYRRLTSAPPTLSDEERFQLSRDVSVAVADLRNGLMLGLLGPDSLAQAEDVLTGAAKEVRRVAGDFSINETYDGQSTADRLRAAWADPGAHDRALRELGSARDSLLAACRATFGDYRTSAPGDSE